MLEADESFYICSESRELTRIYSSNGCRVVVYKLIKGKIFAHAHTLARTHTIDAKIG